MNHEHEKVVVFRDRHERKIHTYVNHCGHGANMDLKDFISLVAELYGSPATTMTRSGLLEGLQEAAAKAIHHMKAQTREVAALNIPE